MSRFVEISHDLWRNVIDFYLPSQVPPPPSPRAPMIDVAHVPFVYNYHCQNNKKTDEIFDKNLHIKNHISKVGK